MSRAPGLCARAVIVALATAGAMSRAQLPLLADAPALQTGDTPSALAHVIALESARDAGLAWVVEDLAAEILAAPGLSQNAAGRVRLALADARLQRGASREATAALNDIPGVSAPKNLRLALAAYAESNLPESATRLNACDPASLGESDRIWHEVLAGLLECRRGELAAGLARMDKARKRCTHAAVSAQIGILRIRAIMLAKQPDSDAISDLGGLLDILPDPRQTYQLGKTQAFALYARGKKTEALARLALLPVRDKDLMAERNLLSGIIAGGRSPEGRASLLAAIDAEGFKDIRRAALNALTEAVLGTPKEEVLLQVNPVYNALTERADTASATEIADLIHLARARLMIFAASASSETAGDSARQKAAAALEEIITRHAGSPVIPEALLLSAESSRESGAYRKAAVAYEKLAALVNAADAHNLHLAAADCYARNNDYANAAAAYANARKGLADPAARGAALLGEVRSRLAEGRTDDAARTLDAAAGVSDESRLRATWFVADARRIDGATAESMRLVNKSLAASPPPVARLRFLWLRALLELARSDGTKAAATAAEIAGIASGPAAEPPSEIRDHAPTILAQTALLRARAALVAGDMRAALGGFKTLRENHPGTLSAASSYLVEGKHLAAEGRHSEAMETFISGYENARKSTDAAVLETAHDALFSAAIEALTLADQRGGDMLRTAFDLLDRLTKDPALVQNRNAANLFHRARLMQGDILRRLNEFDSAFKLYEDLSRTHPDHPDRLRADIARADCLLEKSDSRPEFYPVAAAEYERLYKLPGRPADLAAEAGYKRAFAVSKSPVKGSNNAASNAALARREAAKLLWLQTVDLLGESASLGPRGRHWIARALLLLSELEARDGRIVEARAAVRRLMDENAGQPDVSRRLPGEAIARRTLETLSTTPTAPGNP